MPQRYVLESGVSRRLGAYLTGLGERCLVVCDRHPSDEFLAEISKGIMRGSSVQSVETLRILRPKCIKPAARELAGAIRESGADLVVAFGASKILDLARAALRCLEPARPALVLVPSVVSSNACVGSLAVMYGDDGLPSGFWKLAEPPELVAVDPQLIAEASPRLLASALGDQIASSLEAIQCARRTGKGQDFPGICDHLHALETIAEHGRAALGSVGEGAVNPSLERVLRAVTYYTPEQEACAAANLCHVLGTAISADGRFAAFSHGEVVGALVPAELVFADDEDGALRWIRVMAGLGIPLGFAGLGMSEVRPDLVDRFVGIAAESLIGQGSSVAADRDRATSAVLRAEELIFSTAKEPANN